MYDDDDVDDDCDASIEIKIINIIVEMNNIYIRMVYY